MRMIVAIPLGHAICFRCFMLMTSKVESFARTNVIILAENRLVREALDKILQKENGIRVMATYSCDSNIVEQLAEARPDVLVLDPTGLSSCAQIILAVIRAAPGVKVVVIAMEPDAITFLRLVRAGIVGYLLKDASAAEVVAAVRAVSEGKAICPPQLCLALFKWLAHQEIPFSNLNGKLQFGLTRREIQILRIISCGCTNKEVAVQLNLSEQTVKNHVHRLLQKLGAANRLEALEVFHVRGFDVHSVTIEGQTGPDTSNLIVQYPHGEDLYRN
jgi:DNA-binding NarL/FixJ family response regulator